MEFQYLGTAAAEGVPALWCECANCKKSRAAGGRSIRTRTQAVVDGNLLIDFPADTYAHFLNNGLDLLNFKYLIITHSHEDHLYPREFDMLAPGFSHVPDGFKLDIFGSDKVSEMLKPDIERIKLCEFHEVKAFERFKAGKYDITALPAIHDANSGPLFYMISDGEKTMLYAHDTHFFRDDVWDYFKSEKPKFDFVSLDCTNACLPMSYVGHMSLAENVKVREKLLSMGCADEKTIFVCNHFSHNGTNSAYEDFVPFAKEAGFGVSYDGMTVEF